MTRVKGGTVARNRRKKILKEAEGYFGSKHRLIKTAEEQLMHSRTYAYRDRRQNKRNFRKLWITRINAACRENEISYSRFINGLTKANVTINRKMLSELAIDNQEAFKELVHVAKSALDGTLVKSEAKKEVKKTVPVKEETTKKAPAKKTTTKKEETPKKAAAPKKEASKKTVKKESK